MSTRYIRSRSLPSWRSGALAIIILEKIQEEICRWLSWLAGLLPCSTTTTTTRRRSTNHAALYCAVRANTTASKRPAQHQLRVLYPQYKLISSHLTISFPISSPPSLVQQDGHKAQCTRGNEPDGHTVHGWMDGGDASSRRNSPSGTRFGSRNWKEERKGAPSLPPSLPSVSQGRKKGRSIIIIYHLSMYFFAVRLEDDVLPGRWIPSAGFRLRIIRYLHRLVNLPRSIYCYSVDS